MAHGRGALESDRKEGRRFARFAHRTLRWVEAAKPTPLGWIGFTPNSAASRPSPLRGRPAGGSDLDLRFAWFMRAPAVGHDESAPSLWASWVFSRLLARLLA